MRTPLSVFVTLTVVSATALLGITASPAAAVCTQAAKAGEQISDTPWPQLLWDYSKLPATGTNIKVAVLDSGVDIRNPQLRGKVAAVKDYLRSVPESEDCVGHGTGVAGLIVGSPPASGTGFRGLAPDARIISARISENVPGHEGGNAESADDGEMADAIRWAVSQGAKVINLSLAYQSEASVPLLKQAIKEAIAQGVVVVAAAGNNYTAGNPRPFPASWDDVIGVAAVDEHNLRLEQSGMGDFVDIAAPGVGVVMPSLISGHATQGGTSFAAPLVAATAALIFSRYPKITGPQVVRRLLATADPAPGGRNSLGWGVGIVNPYRALTEPVDEVAPVAALPLPATSINPSVEADKKQAEEIKYQSWQIAGIGLVAAMIAVALMVALPAGSRRRWRPAGRV